MSAPQDEPVATVKLIWGNVVSLSATPPQLALLRTMDNASLYAQSPAAVRAAAIAECARVCEMHASSTWNDDRRAQARLDANEIRALSHRPTVSEAEIAKVVYGSTLYHTQLEAVSAVLQSLGYEVKP